MLHARGFEIDVGDVTGAFDLGIAFEVLGNENLLRVQLDLVGGRIIFHVGFPRAEIELRKGQEILLTKQVRTTGSSHSNLIIPLAEFAEAVKNGANTVVFRRLDENKD